MKKFIKSAFIYCLGLFIIALGVAFSIISNMGVSPVNSIPYVISQIFNIELGVCTTTVFAIFIFIQFVLLGKDFKIINLLQLICSALFGFFVSLASFITSPIVIGDFYPLRVVICGISVLLIAIGIFLYLTADLISLPSEGVALAMSKKFNLSLPNSKTIFDCTVVGFAAVLSLIFQHSIIGVREGTVIAAIFVGVCLKYVRKILLKPVTEFINS